MNSMTNINTANVFDGCTKLTYISAPNLTTLTGDRVF